MYQDVTATFESFYTGTSPRLIRFAYGLTGDMSEAQDLSQEAYARAWQRWKRLQRYDNPESWLRLVVSRLAADRWRWLSARRNKPLADAHYVPGPNEEMTTLIAALKRLPMAQRRALVLHYFLDLPIAEIATETGVNVNTVKTWLSRGRANMAVHLTEAPSGVQAAIAKGRKRTIATVISWFLITATATAAAFVFLLPPGPPPVVKPDLLIRFGTPPRVAASVLDGERAINYWHTPDGHAWVGVINLKSGSVPWQPFEMGRYDDSVIPLGVFGNVFVLEGIDDSSQSSGTTLFGVDLSTGKIAWKRDQEADGGAAFNLHFGFNGSGSHVVILVNPSATTGIDPLTGQVIWQELSTKDSYIIQAGERFAEFLPGGLLRIHDSQTGKVLSETSGVMAQMGSTVTFLDDWLYLADQGGIYRMPADGKQPPALFAAGSAFSVSPCGKRICLMGDGVAAVFDRSTGKQLWRQNFDGIGRASSSDSGFAVPMTGHGERDQFGMRPDDHYVVLDLDGRDITPPNLGTRRISWLGSDHLLLERALELNVATSDNPNPPRHVDVSVYSMRTKTEQSLGEQYLYGTCAGLPERYYVCPGKDGFTRYS